MRVVNFSHCYYYITYKLKILREARGDTKIMCCVSP